LELSSGNDSLFPESDAAVIASGGLVLECYEDHPESPHGAYWTHSISGFRSAAAVYLSSVLEPTHSIPERYYLTPKACQGILRRARRRGKSLPPVLETALRLRAFGTLAPQEPEVLPIAPPKVVQPSEPRWETIDMFS